MKNKERPGSSSKFEHQQLQALLDETACHSQKQLAMPLDFAQQAVSDRLHTMSKILKEEIWVPHELNGIQLENRKVISGMLCNGTKENHFYIEF